MLAVLHSNSSVYDTLSLIGCVLLAGCAGDRVGGGELLSFLKYSTICSDVADGTSSRTSDGDGSTASDSWHSGPGARSGNTCSIRAGSVKAFLFLLLNRRVVLNRLAHSSRSATSCLFSDEPDCKRFPNSIFTALENIEQIVSLLSKCSLL